MSAHSSTIATRFGEKHDVTALLGGEIRQDKNTINISERYGYDDQRLTYGQVDWRTLSQTGVIGQLYANSRTKAENLYVADVKHRYVSAYFNAGYVYDSRYSLNASVRVEQADLFGSDPKYRYRPLWSVGGSWNINNEEFMRNLTWLSLLKIRATYGVTGMVDQTSSPYLLASFASSPYTNSPITIITTPPTARCAGKRPRLSTSAWTSRCSTASRAASTSTISTAPTCSSTRASTRPSASTAWREPTTAR